LRPQYHADYYGAFVRDPDGHRIEAVCHAPEARWSLANAEAASRRALPRRCYAFSQTESCEKVALSGQF
ncbi:MAG TPA: hypothetical protein VJ349_13805, partial [Stellaceae bacterium]|nr:hypothetical protein [Stellaceae bacterium]